ncbi:MAG: hypothetical protein IJS15_15540 [Victivallales bacterium]|nr:hypothetical protein [Victivallales bacterium]
MKGYRLLLAASAMLCLVHGVSAAPAMKVKMAEMYVKNAEGGGFTAKSAAKEARQRVDALKKEYGEDDPDVQALEKRLQAVENKDKAAQEAKAAQQQAEREKNEADNKAKAAKLLPAAPAVIAHTAPRPWVLEKDYESWNDKHPVNKYVKNLGKEKREDVLELDKQLRARIEEDRKIVAAGGKGAEEAEQEIERYEAFLGKLGTVVSINSDIKIDVEKKKMDFYYVKVFFSNFSRDVKYNKADGKSYFYGKNGEPEYIREKEIPYAEETRKCMAFINVFCANQGNDHYMQIQSKAAVCAMNIEKAIKNNSPDVVIFHPFSQFPKGSMHDALAKDALACAKGAFPNAVDVIVNSNDWAINRNQWGVIISRICSGWMVVQDDLGKKVIPARWYQDNQGGDKYGILQLGTYGGNSIFYVK